MSNIDHINACLLVWTNIDPEHEEQFNEWYSREHLRSRVVGVRGFDSGRRLVAEIGGPKYVAYYEARDRSTFSSPSFLDLVAKPDPLSKRFIPLFRNVIRVVGRKLGGVGEDFGGSVGVLAFDSETHAADDMQTWLRALPAQLVTHPGIVRAQSFAIDADTLGASVRVHTRSSDRAPQFVVLAEGTFPDQVDAVRQKILSDKAILEHGGRDVAYARTRLMLDVRSAMFEA